MTARFRLLTLLSAGSVVVALSVATWVIFLGWSDDHPVLFWWQRTGALCTITVASAVGVRWLGPWWTWLCTSVPLSAVGGYVTFHVDVLGPIGAVVWVTAAIAGTGVVVVVVTGARWALEVARRREAARPVPDR